MLLVIDAGNTDTVFGVYDLDAGEVQAASDGLQNHWRIATQADRTADEQAVMIRGFLDLAGYMWTDDIDGVAICSGVPRATANLRNMCARHLNLEPVVLEPGVKTGISILYNDPKEVGPDRIANAVAAYELYGGPTIMVDFGTGTTCDAVSADGEYLGGAIAPGIEISLSALFGRASLVRQVALEQPSEVLGKSTMESIQSGTGFGYAAMVDGLCARIEDELGECTIVATGGLAHLIAPLSSSIEHVEPWLTLHGLRLVYDMNS